MRKFKNVCWCKTTQEVRKAFNIDITRVEYILKNISDNIPEEISAEYYFDVSLTGIVRIYIYPSRESCFSDEPFSEDMTIRINSFFHFYCGKVGEKNIRPNSGKVYYSYMNKKEDKFGKYDLLILVEDCNKLTCKIEAVTEEVTVFKIKC